MHGRLAAILLVGAALLWDGCGETSPKNPSSDASPNHATDGQPSLPDGISNPSEDAAPFLGCFDHLPVDLLFIVDNSHSMAEEQDNLIRNFPVLIRVLTQPPDRNRDGRPDFQPVEDIRIGITSTDLGTAPYRVEGCNTTGGDRGILITQPRTSDPSCADVRLSPSEPWLSYRLGDDINQLAHRFSCLARLGINGCGLEQQLEAMYQAIVVQAAPGMPNAGFVRNNSLFGVVFITDEDDCSAADPTIFDPARNRDLGPYGTRCAFHPEFLHPLERYANALDGLRLDRRFPVVVAAITGIPPNPSGVDPLSLNIEQLLRDERMQYRESASLRGQLEPACDRPGAGSAVPARRIVEFAHRFSLRNRGALIASICDDDFSIALESLAILLGRHICPPLG